MDPSRRRQLSERARRSGSRCLALAVAVWLSSLALLDRASAAEGEAHELQLEVVINGQNTGLIGSFTLLPDGRLAARPQDLRDIGIKADDDAAGPDGLVPLAALPGVAALYDESRQMLTVTVSDDQRVAKQLSATGDDDAKLEFAESSIGLAINYGFYASAGNNSDWDDFDFSAFGFNGASMSLEMWGFSEYGVLANYMVLRSDGFEAPDMLRLDTYWQYADPVNLMTYTVGDAITRGPAWSRAIRFGGAQVSRNFGLSPDLVTIPQPTATGNAAVPSTVDVYVNNVRAHTQDVPAGPFVISNIPAVTGDGNVRMVVRDANGREVVTESSFFSSGQLLAPGLFDFSASAGFARRDYGYASMNYDPSPVGNASVRYGLNEWLTLDGHAEGAVNLANASVGATFPLFNEAVIGVGVGGSISDGDWGSVLYGSVETTLYGFSIAASTTRTIGDYKDLVTVTADNEDGDDTDFFFGATGTEFPIAFDRLSVSWPMPWISETSGASFAFIHIDNKNEADQDSLILSAAYSQQVFGNISFYLTAFTDLDSSPVPSVFAGLSMPIGDRTASAGVAVDQDGGFSSQVTYAKALGDAPGSTGWRFQDNEGASTLRQAAGAYRHNWGMVEGTIGQDDSGFQGSGYAEGGVVAMPGSVYFTPVITDAFVLVDAGAEGVPVSVENKHVTTTGRDGRALVTGLRSYEENAIAIDPTRLPVDASVPKTKAVVVPRSKSGVLVSFGAKPVGKAAVVLFVDDKGGPLAAGTAGVLGDGTEFVVGYDGRAYIEGLQPQNTAVLTLGMASCQASFNYMEISGTQVEIGPVECLAP